MQADFILKEPPPMGAPPTGGQSKEGGEFILDYFMEIERDPECFSQLWILEKNIWIKGIKSLSETQMF